MSANSPWAISSWPKRNARSFTARLKEWRESDARVVIYFQTEGEIERFREIIGGSRRSQGVESSGRNAGSRILFSGWQSRCPFRGRIVRPVSGPRATTVATRGTLGRNRAQIDFSELNEGDLVVHLEHGVGRFLCRLMTEMSPDPRRRTPNKKCSRSNSPTKRNSTSRSSRPIWFRATSELAKNRPRSVHSRMRNGRARKRTPPRPSSITPGKCSRVQAERETQTGPRFWPRHEMAGRIRTFLSVSRNARSAQSHHRHQKRYGTPRSMDRLICGDVGFGKTEVAIRAAFKAVMEGKQVAVLTPTTVLAQQHFETFRQRMLDYPVRIEMLSRFRSQGEQRKVLEAAARRRRRHCHRHASAHFRRCRFQGSGSGRHRRRTTLRRSA